MYKKTTLKNGLRIITVPNKGTKAVTLLVAIAVGWKYETKDINGISHFLEHMFFKGTKTRPNKMELLEPLDRIGGMYNASTSEEVTSFFAKVDYKHLDIALDIISDILVNPRFDQKEVNKERNVIMEEINMYEDTPVQRIEDLWTELLYGDQPAGWPGLGTKKTVAELSRTQLKDYFNKYYLSSSTVICVAGNIDEKKAIKEVKSHFGRLKTGKTKPKEKVIESQKKPGHLIHSKKTDQTHLLLGVKGYDLFNPKRFAQLVLATILGGYMSSRLFMSIREERGLAYHISAVSQSNTDTGYVAAWAGVDNTKKKKVIKLILKEYIDLKNKKVSKSELNKAKDNIKGKVTLSLESSDAQASFYAGQEILTDKIYSLEDRIKKIDAVSAEDIQRIAKELFVPEKLNLALIGPFRDKNKFNKLLKI